MAKAQKKRTQKRFSPQFFLWIGGVTGLIVIVVSGLLFFTPRYRATHGFQTLSSVASYAARMPEYPSMDNTNMVRPDYTSFHRKQLRGVVRQKLMTILSWLRMYTAPDWSPSYFETLLKESIIRKQQHKVRKNIVYKVTPKVGTQFVVWGDLSGAFHSLVRTLQKLKEMSIIDENLRIVSSDTYFVCMGDAVSRSAYGLETLSLLLRLQEVNPDRVVYLRGNHEDNKYWHAFGMKDQLVTRCGAEHADHLVKQIDEYFMHLPLALYVPVLGHKHSYVRLSHLGRARSKKLHEERYAHFLHAWQQGSIDRHQISKSVRDATEVSVAAVIRSEKKRHTFQATDGVRLLAPDEGATAWTVLSSPTLVQQKGLKFFHDAFALITVGEMQAQWALTLYAQDVRDMDGFITRSYQFFTGVEMSRADIAQQKDTPEQKDAQPVSEERLLPSVEPIQKPMQAVKKSSAVEKQTEAQQRLEEMIQNLEQSHIRLQKAMHVPESALPRPQPVVVAQPSPHQSIENVARVNESVSVTVTPPQAGAADQSTIVSVAIKVPASKSNQPENSMDTGAGSSDATATNSPAMAVVKPVIRAQQEDDTTVDIAATAERIALLDQAPR